MNWKKNVIIAAGLLVVVGSCKKDSGPTTVAPPVADHIVPLQIGNQWTYRLTQYDSSGRTVSVLFDSSMVVRDSLVGNERWFQWRRSSALTTNRSDGYWWFTNDGVPRLYTKYPAIINETYRFDDDTVDYKIIHITSTDSLVAVPFGTFACYVYEWRSNHGTLLYTYFNAVNKGPIRLDIYLQSNGGRDYVTMRYELISLTLN